MTYELEKDLAAYDDGTYDANPIMSAPISPAPAVGTPGRASTSPAGKSDAMELTIQQSDLVFGAGRALAAVPSKSTQPVLNCVLLEADASGLRITGTDLEITASVHVPCAVKRQGRAAVSARHFHEVVRKLTKGEVSLAMSDGQCEVRYG